MTVRRRHSAGAVTVVADARGVRTERGSTKRDHSDDVVDHARPRSKCGDPTKARAR